MAKGPAVFHHGAPPAALRTGVSLHSHTRHSRESLNFIPQFAGRMPMVSAWLRQEAARYERWSGHPLDFQRGYWTGPLNGAEAWALERTAIENQGRAALVSLTDHDNIEAPLSLQNVPGVPVSVEWTVPYRSTILHLGVHNLPPQRATRILAEMQDGMTGRRLPEMLAALHAWPQVLVVLNHPLWDLRRRPAAAHAVALLDFLENYRHWLHALEWNGLRPDHENRSVLRLAEGLGMSVVSGGDRHGLEPNAVLNLTAAARFEEFVDEVRCGHRSDILILPQYYEPRPLRVLGAMWDILRDYPRHAEGQVRWSDRVFYEPEGQPPRSLSSCWQGEGPHLARMFLGLLRILEAPCLRPVLRATLGAEGEKLPHVA
jgi:hypothetical protein